MALAAGGLALLDHFVKSLVSSLSHDDWLAKISNEQAAELAKKLQELHSQMDFMLRRNAVVQRRSSILFSRSLNGLESSTEDLGDIIEDLLLSCNQEFRTILVDCVKALPSHSAELVERM